ncbi:hypothetical protein ACH5RR_031314 [Cinchona calisaya]|uniref:Uncharacterized protein n=1 Tax=Cinchona calisaya TaxID=153742 RepID=A0ABD2YEW3_9GENT
MKMMMRDAFDSSMNGHALKKLRKLPHVFGKVLELPFRSDDDVAVEDSHENIRFIAKIEVNNNNVVNDVRARAVEIHPGVTKIVVRKDGGDLDLLLDKLNVDTWRFRLPRSAQPGLASAVFVNGELIVTVPKGNSRDFGAMDVWRGDSHLVLAQ